MLSITVGDIVRFKPRYYGSGQPDQWVGVTGLVLEVIEAAGSRTGLNVLVQHPEEPSPIPVFAFVDDVELFGCAYCNCDPCDCNPYDDD